MGARGGVQPSYIGPDTAHRRVQLATPNYSYEKRQRELAKKRKAEEKRQRKLQGKTGDGAAPDDTAPEGEAAPPPAEPADPQT